MSNDNIIQFKKSNVVPLTPRTSVYTLNFKCPNVVTMNKTEEDDIVLEMSNGRGTAWVPAKNITEAKNKLHKMMPITEWIDD